MGLATSWQLIALGPMAKLAAGAVLAGGATLGASAGITLGTSSHPGLGVFARIARLATLAAACRGRRLPLLLVTLAGPERDLRRPIVSSIDIMETSSRDSIEASHLLVLLGDATKELLDSSLLVVVFVVLRRRAKSSTSSPGFKARLSHSLRSACSVDLRARSLPMLVIAMASQASLAVRFLAGLRR
jgi:hypothetical protein